MRAKYLILTSTLPLVLALTLANVGCEEDLGRSDADEAILARGAHLIHSKGCGSCHIIPGVDGADGVVGPPLNEWNRRVYIAGRLPNNSDNLIRWLIDTHGVLPDSAMPELDLSNQEAKDIAAYLYTLRQESP